MGQCISAHTSGATESTSEIFTVNNLLTCEQPPIRRWFQDNYKQSRKREGFECGIQEQAEARTVANTVTLAHHTASQREFPMPLRSVAARAAERFAWEDGRRENTIRGIPASRQKSTSPANESQ